MRIAHFTYNTTGGAGKAAVQLHNLFLKNGFESALINTQTHQPEAHLYTVPALSDRIRNLINKCRYYTYRLYVRVRYPKKKNYAFSYNNNYRGLSFKEIKQAIPFKPDIIFLHWIADFILPEHIVAAADHYQCHIIWRYNDWAPLTGGCHYICGCENYKDSCGHCPAIGSKKINDHSHKFWLQKKEALQNIPLTVINSTREMEIAYKTSRLFSGKRQEFIRNSIHGGLYNSSGRVQAKAMLNIPPGIKVFFWGATYITEERKGFRYFIAAAEELRKESGAEVLLLIGGQKPDSYNPDISLPHRFTGLLNTEELALHYKAADAVIITSLEDGGPVMIAESMLCGTPVVSFATGLANELVITAETGFRAEKGNIKDLKKGMEYILNLQAAEKAELSENCIRLATQLYSQETEMKHYIELFKQLTGVSS